MVGEVESEELVLHAVFNGEVKKKQQWLRERGIFPGDFAFVSRDLTALLQYIEEKQITNIRLDELKSTWNALEEETFEEIKALVEGGADISARDKYGKTVLHEAARNGNTDAISLLLDRGADVNAENNIRSTALHQAAEYGNTDAISLLLDRDADVDAAGDNGETALNRAAGYGKKNTISLLLDRGADVNATNNDGWTALHRAIGNVTMDVISLLLDHGADVSATREDGETALHEAAGYGMTDTMSFLLDRGADVNATDNDGKTVLYKAIGWSNKDAISLLLDRDADVNAKNNDGETALHKAVGWGNTDVISLLVERGADVNAKNNNGETALHKAAGKGNTDVISLLLDRNADVNAKNNDGETALHKVVGWGNTDVISLLLDRGADVNAKNNNGETALHDAAGKGKTDAMLLLLDRNADVNATNNDGETALHLAAGKFGNTDAISLLLDRGASIDAVDKKDHSPLTLMIWEAPTYGLDEKIASARLLCSRGSNPNLSASADKSSLQPHQLGLLACARHWHECYQNGIKSLPDIQSEVVRGGEDAVKTYLDDLASSVDQLVYRSKICIVGPSTWGKTSLVKSVTTKKPSEVDEEDQTIGIDLFPFTFDVEGSNDETDSKKKLYDVTFWDFAGQDIYQVTHVLFFSERTLYLLCVDLSAYAEKLVEAKTRDSKEKHAMMQRFFEEKVLRWVRLILFRQPSAQFKMIWTKKDLISDAELNDISVDMNDHMDLCLNKLDGDGVSTDVKSALADVFKPENRKTISARQGDSVKVARKFIKQAIIDNPELSFKMTVMYKQVLEAIFKIKQDSERSTPEDRVKQVIIPLCELRDKLRRDVPNLEDAGQIREILRVLHRLGDIQWYEDEDDDTVKDEDKHTSINPGDFVILDPKIMPDIIREVVNHKYEKKGEEKDKEKGKDDELYEALSRDGTLHHTLLVKSPLWNVLAKDSDMVHLFKYLLQHLGLAYPARNVKWLGNVDMIVPAYWRTREEVQKEAKSLTKRSSILTRNAVVGLVIAKWRYSLPFDISEAVYVNFVVRCYRPSVIRKVGATCVVSFVHNLFSAVITFDVNVTEQRDNIMIEVAAATEDIAWVEMRDFVMEMEKILLKYPGLMTTKQKEFGRFVIDSEDKPNEVSLLMDDTRDVDRLRKDYPWLPPDFDWFIQRAWQVPGKLKELKAQNIVVQVPHQLNVLQQLLVTRDRRKSPALWTLKYSKEERIIELRILSDLTRICHHVPLRIAAPNNFVASHVDHFETGVSVLSIISEAIPLALVKGTVQKALSESKDALDHVQKLKSILDRTISSSGVEESSEEWDLSLTQRMAYLLALLKLHDPTFEEFMIGEIANLRDACDEKGCAMWVHPEELKDPKNRLPSCDSPETKRPIGPRTTPPPNITLILTSISVAGLRRTGRVKSHKKLYCEWEIIHKSKQAATGIIEEAADSDGDLKWACLPVKLNGATSIAMLCECTVKITVMQSRRLTSSFDKVVGQGEVQLKSYKDAIDTACSSSKPVEIEIKLGDDKISPYSTAILEISIGSTDSSSP